MLYALIKHEIELEETDEMGRHYYLIPGQYYKVKRKGDTQCELEIPLFENICLDSNDVGISYDLVEAEEKQQVKNQIRERRRKELDQYDKNYQSTVKYFQLCGECITRKATEEEIEHYERIFRREKDESKSNYIYT